MAYRKSQKKTAKRTMKKKGGRKHRKTMRKH